MTENPTQIPETTPEEWKNGATSLLQNSGDFRATSNHLEYSLAIGALLSSSAPEDAPENTLETLGARMQQLNDLLLAREIWTVLPNKQYFDIPDYNGKPGDIATVQEELGIQLDYLRANALLKRYRDFLEPKEPSSTQ